MTFFHNKTTTKNNSEGFLFQIEKLQVPAGIKQNLPPFQPKPTKGLFQTQPCPWSLFSTRTFCPISSLLLEYLLLATYYPEVTMLLFWIIPKCKINKQKILKDTVQDALHIKLIQQANNCIITLFSQVQYILHISFHSYRGDLYWSHNLARRASQMLL